MFKFGKTLLDRISDLQKEANDVINVFEDTADKLAAINAKMEIEEVTLQEEIDKLQGIQKAVSDKKAKNTRIIMKITEFLK
jgi:hypothetical protein